MLSFNKPFFNQQYINNLNKEFNQVKSRYENLIIANESTFGKLNEQSSKEYLRFGVSRRLKVLKRCLIKTFEIFPPERISRLNSDELADLDINLHAFIFNVFGLLDCVAWVLISERASKSFDKRKVGLFITETQTFLSEAFKEYLNSEKMKRWHGEYLTEFRHSLAHRIPPYVPPKQLIPEQQEAVNAILKDIEEAWRQGDFSKAGELGRKEDEIGNICAAYICSSGKNKALVLHAQLLADFKTVEEILDNFYKEFSKVC